MLDIMIPFWGEPRYLYETVEAVLSQTDARWHLTVVDDCYPDPGVPKYFEHLDHPQVTYVRNEENLGITANYERCIEMASADLVMLLGCDDIMRPDYVARVLTLHEKFPQADIFQPGVQPIDSQGHDVSTLTDSIKRVVMPRTRQPLLLSGEELATSLLRADWLYWPSLTFRREALVSTPFRPGFPIIQDLALIIDIIAAGGCLLLDPHVCFSYRRHEESASSTSLFDGRRFAGERTSVALAARLMRRNGWHRAARAAGRHTISRAHALSLLPTALRRQDSTAVRTLTTHVLAR